YRCIGRGNCGSVWALDGDQEDVYKREDGAQGRSILNDQTMHRRVLSSAPPIRVPRSFSIIEASDSEWWAGANGLARFPNAMSPCRTYHMQRIPAMPEAVRRKLIDEYCPKSLQAFVTTNRDDEDCLIRLYLGRRRALRQAARFQFFSLRNFPLHVNQMEDLGMDTHALARVLADCLAHCHWKARVDANDVEFVLAPATVREDDRAELPLVQAFGGEYAVWMLDYDCCREMSMDEEGVDQAVRAFYRNDPYYPRPFAYGYTDVDGLLWQTFRTRFLECSRRI
ncbi:hypothetical protein CC80DRAFT_351600, partial [Byssothecium circinans]